MSTVYFLRHGQAGLRDDYDRLSPLGHEQARRLGAFAAAQGWRFDHVIAGGLRRQQETAAAVVNAAGLQTPVIDARWNEFDIDAVIAGIAPQLAARDESFRQAFSEIEDLVRAGDTQIHRQWRPADSQVVHAWITGSCPYGGESWPQFVERVRQAGAALQELPANAHAAVFTSATPIAIWIAAAFHTDHPALIMKLAAAAINSNITILRFHNGEPHLHCYNAVPHLDEPHLRTLR